MIFPKKLIVLSLAAAILPGTALAQSAEDGEQVEEIVVTSRMGRFSATKSDTPILETARSVSIESQIDLLDKGALNLSDAYLYSAGVVGDRYGFATRGDWVAVRGLEVPEYRDSLQGLFGNYNNTRPDVYTIEQVEVLKGPASVLYGQGSPGGIVNVVSKLPLDESRREVVVEAGNYNRGQIAADFTGRIDNDGEWLYRFVSVYRNTDTQVDEVGEESMVLAPSITWRPSDRTNITALLNLQKTDTDVGEQFHLVDGTLRPGPDGRRIDFDTYLGEPDFNKYDTESDSLTLLADHIISDIWSVEATARVTGGESAYNQAWPAFIGGDRYVYNPDGSLYRDGMVPRTFYVATGSSEQFATDVRARASFMTGDAEHEVLLGAMYQDVTTDDATSYMFALGYDFLTAGPDAVLGDAFWVNVYDPVHTGLLPPQEIVDAYMVDTPESNTRDMGFYINDQISIGPWSLLLGLRHDEVKNDNGSSTQQDDALSYSIGALYRFDNGFSPYVSFAESFQPVVGIDTITGEALKPREGEQLEVGFKYQPGNSSAYLTLAWFDMEESNLGNPNALIGANSQQEGVSEISGIEIETVVPFGDLRWETNLSALDAEDPNGYTFASLPEKQASTWVTWRPKGELVGFKLGAGVRYVGESWDGMDLLKTPSYTLGDLMVGYEGNGWDATLNIRNVADKEYAATCLGRGDCFLGENRTIVARVTHRF